MLFGPSLFSVSSKRQEVTLVVEILDQLKKLIAVVDEMLDVVIFQIVTACGTPG